MKLFQNVRAYFETMGIYSYQTNQAQSFNGKILLILLPLLVMFTSTSTFLIFKASDTFEYVSCLYWCITRPTAMAVYLIFWFQMPKIIKFIGDCEQFVEMSEWNQLQILFYGIKFLMLVNFGSIIGMKCESTSSIIIYNKVVTKIEHFSKSTHFILMNVVPVVVIVLPTITTYIKYFVLGMDDASFVDLPYVYGIWKPIYGLYIGH